MWFWQLSHGDIVNDYTEYINSIISPKLIACLGIAKHFYNSCTKLKKKYAVTYTQGANKSLLTPASVYSTLAYLLPLPWEKK